MDKSLFIVKTLSDNGYVAYYCGGCVRDRLLGIEPNDIDIATNARPEEIERLFDKTISVGKAFGVIIVVIDGEEFEVATFRSDGQYSDGRHPDSVSFSNLEEDAKRRDLTINGMYYNPLDGRIIDVVGGQTDLEQKVVRLIRNPTQTQRITEDKLRLLRVIRFASRFGFEIEPETYIAVKENAGKINEVSTERIADEMTKILRVKDKRRAINLLFDTTLMHSILPEFVLMKGCEQPPQFHPEGARVRKIFQMNDVNLGPFEIFDIKNLEHLDSTKYKMYPGDCLEHTIVSLELLPEDASDTLLWGTFLHDIGKPLTQTFEDRIRFSGHDIKGFYLTEEILRRLKFSNDFIEHVCSLVKNHMKFSCVMKMRVSKLKRFMNLPKFEEHLALHKVDCVSSHGSTRNYDFLQEKLKTFEATPEKVMLDKLPRILTGYDLIKLGYKVGPYFRVILTDIEDQQLEDKIISHEQALEYIKDKYPIDENSFVGEDNARSSEECEEAGCEE